MASRVDTAGDNQKPMRKFETSAEAFKKLYYSKKLTNTDCMFAFSIT